MLISSREVPPHVETLDPQKWQFEELGCRELTPAVYLVADKSGGLDGTVAGGHRAIAGDAAVVEGDCCPKGAMHIIIVALKQRILHQEAGSRYNQQGCSKAADIKCISALGKLTGIFCQNAQGFAA